MSTPDHPNLESPVNLHDDLITEILSFSDVKSLMQIRCVCKSWNSIISDPKFIKLHHKRSARNPHLTLSRSNRPSARNPNLTLSQPNDLNCVFPFPVRRLIDQKLFTHLHDDRRYHIKDNDCQHVIGSCNGLLCLIGYNFSCTCERKRLLFRFWNPVMGTMLKKLWYFSDHPMVINKNCKFGFGYDNSFETYKVVMLMLDEAQNRTHVRVLNVGEGDNVWNTIPDFPAVPLPYRYTGQAGCNGVYLNGRLNWLAIQDRPVSVYGRNWENIKANEFVIVSLDMGTESYTQLMPPRDFDEMSSVMPPSICILRDSLCFSHDFRRTEFIIWQKKIIGVEEPWTQLLKISYQNLQTKYHDFSDLKHCQLLPLHLYDHSDTLILANNQEQRAILYNLRDKTAKRTRIIEDIEWFSAMVYVESLVSDI